MAGIMRQKHQAFVGLGSVYMAINKQSGSKEHQWQGSFARHSLDWKHHQENSGSCRVAKMTGWRRAHATRTCATNLKRQSACIEHGDQRARHSPFHDYFCDIISSTSLEQPGGKKKKSLF